MKQLSIPIQGVSHPIHQFHLNHQIYAGHDGSKKEPKKTKITSKLVRSSLSIGDIFYIDANKKWDPNTKLNCGSSGITQVWMMITMTNHDDGLIRLGGQNVFK